jgi:hypothetical protein
VFRSVTVWSANYKASGRREGLAITSSIGDTPKTLESFSQLLFL